MTNRELEMRVKHIYTMVLDVHEKLLDLEEMVLYLRRDIDSDDHEVVDNETKWWEGICDKLPIHIKKYYLEENNE